MKKSRFSFLVLISVVLMLALAAPAQAATVVVPGLPPVAVPDPPYSGAVLHLPFDEGSGNVTYNALNLSEYGTIYGGEQWVPGKLGYALEFSGDGSDYVTLETTYTLTEWTVLLWANVTQPTSWWQIVGAGGAGYLMFHTFGNKLYFRSISGTYYGGFGTYDEGVMGFYAFTAENNTIKAYKNGNFIGSKAVDDTTLNVRDICKKIGNFNANETLICDELIVFNRALTDQEIQLIYQRGASHRLDVQPNLRQITVPRLDLGSSSATAKVSFEISTSAADALIPIPAAAVDVSAPWAYTIDGKVLTIDDNRYVNATSVNVSIPLRVESHVVEDLPDELILDEDWSYTYVRQVAIHNPSDVSVLASLSVPDTLGFADLRLDGAAMGKINGSFVSSALLSPGETKVINITASVPLAKQEVEFPATFDDFLSIRSFNSSEAFLESAIQGKVETRAKVVRIDASNLGNRSVVLPLGVKVKDVIEAQALTGSKELLTVREGKDGRAEVVVPASAFEGDELGKTAEVKILYNRKPSLLERLGLASLASLIEKIKSILGGG